jgi:hypothetical protein
MCTCAQEEELRATEAGLGGGGHSSWLWGEWQSSPSPRSAPLCTQAQLIQPLEPIIIPKLQSPQNANVTFWEQPKNGRCYGLWISHLKLPKLSASA